MGWITKYELFGKVNLSTEYLNNKKFENIILRFQGSKKDKIRYELIMEDLKDLKNKEELLNKYKIMHKEASERLEIAQNQLAAAFYILSENIVKYTKFNLIDHEDTIQEAVMTCFEKIDRFNPTKGKAFCYSTTICINVLRQIYRTAKNYEELKKKFLDYKMSQNNNLFKNNSKDKDTNNNDRDTTI